VPTESFPDTPSTPAREQVHVSYVPMPSLDRLMGLRDALVALKGPLSNDPRVRESLQRRLLSEEHSKRILGSASTQPSVHP